MLIAREAGSSCVTTARSILVIDDEPQIRRVVLLRVLATNAGRTMTHGQLFSRVWAKAHGDAQQNLRVHVSSLPKARAGPDSTIHDHHRTWRGLSLRAGLVSELV